MDAELEGMDEPCAQEETKLKEQSAWRRAEVRNVEKGPGGPFQVVVHDATGVPKESWTHWCDASNESTDGGEGTWRRIQGPPMFARPAAATSTADGSTALGKRRRRCGMCAGCLEKDCAQRQTATRRTRSKMAA